MNDQELLSYIYQNADVGVDGILKVLEDSQRRETARRIAKPAERV